MEIGVMDNLKIETNIPLQSVMLSLTWKDILTEMFCGMMHKFMIAV